MIRQKMDDYAQQCSQKDVPNIMVDEFENEKGYEDELTESDKQLAKSLRTFRKRLKSGVGSGKKPFDPTTLKNLVELFSGNYF